VWNINESRKEKRNTLKNIRAVRHGEHKLKLPEKLEKAIDGIGLLIALIVDLIVIPICMITIAPDFLTKIAFVCIGVTIVLFVFRSWAKGQKWAWLVFASVVFFFDFSFSIVATQAQSQKVDISQDTELKRIDGEIATSQNQITKLQDERTISTRPETIASISSDIQTENRKIDGLAVDRKAREKELAKTGGIYITADSVFTSIPDAWARKRYIPLVVFGLIFLGLQMVVVTSIDAPKKKDKKTVEVVPAEPVKNILTVSEWIRLEWRGTELDPPKPYVASPEVMNAYCKIANIPWDDEAKSLHADCLKKCYEAGIFSKDNRIVGGKERAERLLTNKTSNAII
jgi:hypothetical protein